MKNIDAQNQTSVDFSQHSFHGIDYSKEKPKLEDALNNILWATHHTEDTKTQETETKISEHKARLDDAPEVRRCQKYIEDFEWIDVTRCEARVKQWTIGRLDEVTWKNLEKAQDILARFLALGENKLDIG